MRFLNSADSFSLITRRIFRRADKTEWVYLPKIPFVLLGVLYISITLHLPVALYSNMAHDDALFWRNAYSIATTGWLGPYNQMILAKGPGFPIFLALNAYSGLPITLSLALLFLGTAYCLNLVLKKLDFPWVIRFFIFFALVLQPMLFPTRVIRDSFYSTLTVLVVAIAIDLLFVRPEDKFSKLQYFALGIACSFFFLTREEGAWVFPALLLISLLIAITFRIRTISFTKISVFGLSVFLVFASVVGINGVKYGVAVENDFTFGSFPKALDALQSVQDGVQKDYVPVSAETREIVYKVSPSFAKLEPYFKGEGMGWTKFGCDYYVSACGDYAGGWFMWAMRDGVERLGFYRNGQAADSFYAQVASEIVFACDAGLLKCKSQPLSFMPRISDAALDRIPKAMMSAWTTSVGPYSDSPVIAPSVGADATLQLSRTFLGSPNFTPATSGSLTNVSGWYKGEGWLSIKCDAPEQTIEVPRLASPDLAEYFVDARMGQSRFSITVPNFDTCNFQIVHDDASKPDSIKIVGIGTVMNGTNQILVDTFTVTDMGRAYSSVLGVHGLLVRAFSLFQPALSLVSLLLVLLVLLSQFNSRSRSDSIQIALFTSIFAWGLVLTRMLIMAVIDASAFPAINFQYLAPAIALLPVAIGSSIYGAFLVLKTFCPLNLKGHEAGFAKPNL